MSLLGIGIYYVLQTIAVFLVCSIFNSICERKDKIPFYIMVALSFVPFGIVFSLIVVIGRILDYKKRYC